MISVRRDLERHVAAHNKCLCKAVRQMPILVLLRNAHPIQRSEFAHILCDCSMITKSQLTEFNQPLRSNVLFGRQ